jgi:hypothetical protein
MNPAQAKCAFGDSLHNALYYRAANALRGCGTIGAVQAASQVNNRLPDLQGLHCFILQHNEVSRFLNPPAARQQARVMFIKQERGDGRLVRQSQCP